ARLEGDQREPDQQQADRMPQPPPDAQAGGVARAAVLGGNQRRDRDQVVGVRGMPKAQRQGNPQRDQQWRAVEEAREPVIDPLHGPKQELEVERCNDRERIHRAHPPSCGIARRVIRVPARTMTLAETAGRAPVRRPPRRRLSGRKRVNARPPQITARPTAVKVAAKPTLNAPIRTIPKPSRCCEMAAIRTTRAEGQGTSPPETPRPTSPRTVSGCPWEWS